MMENKSMPPPPYGFNPQGPTMSIPVPNPCIEIVQPEIEQEEEPMAMVMAMGPESTTLTCPSCHATVSTRVEHETTTKTHLFALILCIVFCPCALIPYCTDCCKATNHYCPSCGAYLGTYDH